jgi:uncharacterized protein (TIGR03435 family)
VDLVAPRLSRGYAACMVRLFVVLAASLAAWSQTPRVEFDAASVKLSADDLQPTSMQGGVGTSDPGRISYRNINLQNLVSIAYGVGAQNVFGPAWLDSVRVDIIAIIPLGTSKTEFRLMFLHLLEQRFKLAAHVETVEASGYALTVARNGPILKPGVEQPVVSASENPPGPVEEPRRFDEDEFPTSPAGPGVQKRCNSDGCRFRATSATMSDFAKALPCPCEIVDETELPGKYSFVLTADVSSLSRPALSPDRPNLLSHRSLPDIFRALQTQLGLKLERKKIPARMVRVDQMDRAPTEN